MNRDILINFINKTLKVEEPEKDPWVFNGLQVDGKDEVKKICLGVSPSLEFFNKSAKVGADMIILHHGLFGPKRPQRINKVLKERLKTLFDGDITLLSYHLYLDNHPTLGNNAQIIKLLGAKLGKPFGNQERMYWGYEGEFGKPISKNDFQKRIEAICPRTISWGKGKDVISKFAVVSGGGGYNIVDAIDRKLDAFLTGEVVESLPAMAVESGIHYYAMGHYDSEKFGVMALGKLLKNKFPELSINFIDIPNPL